MANKSLNEKFEIPFLSEWVDKDGKEITVMKIEYAFRKICNIPIVAYVKTLNDDEKIEMIKNQKINLFIKTVADFKDTYKLKA